MKTAMQEAIKEIAELWSSPSDTPTYTQIFNILESKLEMEKQQIEDAYYNGGDDMCPNGMAGVRQSEQYYNETFKNQLQG